VFQRTNIRFGKNVGIVRGKSSACQPQIGLFGSKTSKAILFEASDHSAAGAPKSTDAVDYSTLLLRGKSRPETMFL
jgi:hypothetical protein